MHVAASTEAGVVDIKHEDVCAQLSWWLTAWTAVMLETHHHLTASVQEASDVIGLLAVLIFISCRCGAGGS